MREHITCSKNLKKIEKEFFQEKKFVDKSDNYQFIWIILLLIKLYVPIFLTCYFPAKTVVLEEGEWETAMENGTK